jgi:hypothetical protein
MKIGESDMRAFQIDVIVGAFGQKHRVSFKVFVLV